MKTLGSYGVCVRLCVCASVCVFVWVNVCLCVCGGGGRVSAFVRLSAC